MIAIANYETLTIMKTKKRKKELEVAPGTLAHRVRQRREELGLTQAQLADLAGTRQQTIQKIEGGIIKRPRNIKAIATALKESPAWLQFGAREIDNLDNDIILTAITLQSLPESLRDGFKRAITEASKIKPNKSS